jgi:hypothetical protein
MLGQFCLIEPRRHSSFSSPGLGPQSKLTSSPSPSNSNRSTLRREASFQRIKQRRTRIDNILSAFERVLGERMRRKRLVCFCKVYWWCRSHDGGTDRSVENGVERRSPLPEVGELPVNVSLGIWVTHHHITSPR